VVREEPKISKKKRRVASFSVKKKSRNNFKDLSIPLDETTQREVTESFQRAFFAKDLTYATELIYDHEDIPQSKNCAEFEKVQKMTKDNEE